MDDPEVFQTRDADADGFKGGRLRYRVKIHRGRSRSSRATGITPQPCLGSHAPPPYGTASVPSEWGTISQSNVYLSVPPLYNSEQADQVQEPPVGAAGGLANAPTPQQFLHASHPEPMSFMRRLKGCFLLSLLGLPFVYNLWVRVTGPCLVHYSRSHRIIIIIDSILRNPVLVLFSTGLEACHSQLAWILMAHVVALDRFAQILDQRPMHKGPMIMLKVNKYRFLPVTQQWFYGHHEDISPPVEDVISHVSQLSSAYKVVRVRLPLWVTLADDRTKGNFITALHSLYVRWPCKDFVVDVLHQGYTVAVVRSGVDRPRNFCVLSILWVASNFLALSWVVRIVVLLFMPHLVDPTFSPIYCHRKRLVARTTST